MFNPLWCAFMNILIWCFVNNQSIHHKEILSDNWIFKRIRYSNNDIIRFFKCPVIEPKLMCWYVVFVIKIHLNVVSSIRSELYEIFQIDFRFPNCQQLKYELHIYYLNNILFVKRKNVKICIQLHPCNNLHNK